MGTSNSGVSANEDKVMTTTLYQYKIVRAHQFGASLEDTNQRFRELGKDGFELVQVDNGFAYFKRAYQVENTNKVEPQEEKKELVPMAEIKTHGKNRLTPSLIRNAMQKFNGNRLLAAEYLHVAYTTLLNNIKKFGMVEEFKKREQFIQKAETRPASEKEYMCQLLEKYNGSRTLVAQEMGISERTMYRKMHDYELTQEFPVKGSRTIDNSTLQNPNK